jgi:mannosyltransferase
MHAWTALLGTSHLALRLPSLLAMVATAWVVGLIGERAHSRRAGLFAGLLFASLPTVSRFAQEARPYSFAGLATLVLLRAMDEPSARRWTWYGVTCTLAGWSHLFAASIVLGHAIAVFMLRWRGGDRRWRGWLAATVAAAVAVAPLAVLGSRQTQQVAWLALTTWQTLPEYLGRLVGVAIVAGIMVGLGLVGFGLGRDRTAAWVVGAAAVVPLTALYLIGAVVPVFHHRYVLFVVVAWAVLAGMSLARAPRVAAVAALVAVVAFSATAHASLRRPDGHSDGGLDEAARLIAAQQRPGDAIVPQNVGWLRLGLDYYLPRDGRPRDAYLARSPAQRGSYLGAECADLAACLGGAQRVWVVCRGVRANPLDCLGPTRAAPLREAYVRTGTTRHGAFSVALYTRTADVPR